MPQPFSENARLTAGVIAVAVLASFVAQISINAQPGQPHIITFALMMRFFTIWTNFAAGLVMAWTAWKGTTDARVLIALTTAIIIVGSVYHLLLAAEHHPVGADWWTNLMFHTVIPAAVTLWWLAFSRPSEMRWRALPTVMIVPVAYTIFALINGALTDFHPYFFLDLPALGWGQLIINMIGLSAFFMLIAATLVSLRKFFAKTSTS